MKGIECGRGEVKSNGLKDWELVKLQQEMRGSPIVVVIVTGSQCGTPTAFRLFNLSAHIISFELVGMTTQVLAPLEIY
jgi:hypothetical protein